MKVEMLNTTKTLGYRCVRFDNGTESTEKCYNIEIIIKTNESTTLEQIDCLLDSFCSLKEINGNGEEFVDRRIITQDVTDDTGRFTARLCLYNTICFSLNEFLCETDDFQTFSWYGRKIKLKEKAEDFKPIK